MSLSDYSGDVGGVLEEVGILDDMSTTDGDDLENLPFLASGGSISKPDKSIDFLFLPNLRNFRKYLGRFSSVQSIFLVLSTILFKFGLESMTGAISLIVINRFQPQSFAITMLAFSTILYNITQSVGVLLLDVFLRFFRASLLLGVSLFIMSLCIGFILVTELLSGGSRIKEGWSGLPFIVIPIQVVLGGCYGLAEVLRKYIAPLIVFENNIVSSDSLTHELKNKSKKPMEGMEKIEEEEEEEVKDRKKLEQLNSVIHICYEVSGTSGAFFAGFMVREFGEVFCMVHIPLLFFIAGFCSILIIHPKPSHESSNEDENVDKPSIRSFVESYVSSVKEGMRTVLLDRRLNFLFFSLLIPQICHRVKENIVVPVYSNELMKKDYFVGIFTGASNFGELVGAGIVLAFTVIFPVTTTGMVVTFLTISGLSLNLLWAYPLVPWKLISLEDSPYIFWGASVSLNIVICLSSVGYVMSDIILLSYLQTEVKDKRVLGSVMGFIYVVYVGFLTILVLIVGQTVDIMKEKFNVNFAFMYVTFLFSLSSIVVILGGPMLLCADKRRRRV